MLKFHLFFFHMQFSFFDHLFQRIWDRQCKLHALIKFLWFLILTTVFPLLSLKHIFRKTRKFQWKNTTLKTCGSSSLWREVFISVVKALHCSGCFSAFRGVHFPICEKDHGTGLALHLFLLGCQGSCGIVLNGPTSSHSGSSVYIRAWGFSM